MTEEQFWFHKASEVFLWEPLPDGWEDKSDEEKAIDLEERAWQPFEDCPGDQIYEHIEDLASIYKRIAEGNIKYES